MVAFHKLWAPGTDSRHTVEFGGRWGGVGGGRSVSVCEDLLLRRPKLTRTLKVRWVSVCE